MMQSGNSVSQSVRFLAPSVGFPITFCVLCYGPHCHLAERFLKSLYLSTPASLFVLRAGLNEVESATRRLFEEYAAQYGNIEIFSEAKNAFKNPLMRRMFNEKPLTSKWVVWCDDDTHFTRPDWLQHLAVRIEHSPKTVMWGSIHLLCLSDPAVLDWIHQAPWFCHRPFRRGTDPQGNPAVEFRFATGAFWAIRTTVLAKLSWPDPRLIHAGEDFLLGEALRQNGLRIGDFHYGVAVNQAFRRNAEAPEVCALLPNRPSCSSDSSRFGRLTSQA